MKGDRRTLSPQEWQASAERIQSVAEGIAMQLRQANVDGRGEEDANECLIDFQIALMAMNYVAHFAADKCVFVNTGE
jgi:hypothetical protein